jgi:hypothetical protein
MLSSYPECKLRDDPDGSNTPVDHSAQVGKPHKKVENPV